MTTRCTYCLSTRFLTNAKRNKGFTLAELLIVVAIIGVLVAISIPIFTSQLEKAREATDAANIRSQYAEVMAEAITEGKNINGKEKFGAVELKQKKDEWQSTGLKENLEGTYGQVVGEYPKAGGTAWVEYDGEKAILHYEGGTGNAGGSTGGSSAGGSTGGSSAGGSTGGNSTGGSTVGSSAGGSTVGSSAGGSTGGSTGGSSVGGSTGGSTVGSTGGSTVGSSAGGSTGGSSTGGSTGGSIGGNIGGSNAGGSTGDGSGSLENPDEINSSTQLPNAFNSSINDWDTVADRDKYPKDSNFFYTIEPGMVYSYKGDIYFGARSVPVEYDQSWKYTPDKVLGWYAMEKPTGKIWQQSDFNNKRLKVNRGDLCKVGDDYYVYNDGGSESYGPLTNDGIWVKINLKPEAE
ncbi:MAG: type II secretion system GspH family protein [Lachnospiraceae bacterium]|jgi:prepilin-type N-terminal cleavage/methylation domain-containing protein|nr:type II secretion system GspH family protein [Lachnospiraceae bacterium]